MSEKFNIPPSAIPLLKSASRQELEALIYISVKSDYTVAAAAEELGMTEPEFAGAIAFWRGASLAMPAGEKKKTARTERDEHYDAETVSKAIEDNTEFREMCGALSRQFGKVFNRYDYDSLLYLYDFCGASAEYLCTVAAHCISCGKRSLRYFVRTAEGLYTDGVDSYSKLEQYLARKERAADRVFELKRMCGFGDRDFTAAEGRYVSDWFEEKNLSIDLVRAAYDRTVSAIGEPKLQYMNKILCDWHSKGWLTPADVDSDKKSNDGKKKNGSFDEDEFFAAAVSRTENRRRQK